jgi:hypothetical protein
MRLPNAERAFADVRKLREYCLDPEHPRGRHKARVFLATAGLGPEHAEQLRADLLGAARTQDAALAAEDEYGRRYVVECAVEGPAGTVVVRSIWIIRKGEDFPRLVTCYVP